MPIDFPNSASVGHIFTSNNNTWVYDSEKWNLVTSINPTGPTGPTGSDGISYTDENYYAYYMSADTVNNILTINTSILAGNYVVRYGNFNNAFILDNNVYMNETFSNTSEIGYNRYISLSESVNNITLYSLFSFNYSNGFFNGTNNVIHDAIHDGTSYLVATSTSGIRASTDGITWTTRTSGFGSTQCRSIVLGNGIYVAAGNGGKIETSTDSITWTIATSNTTDSFTKVIYESGLYVAAGGSGVIRTSTDTVTWTTRTSGFGSSTILNLAYGNGVYVAVGAGGTITTSTDAITWTTRVSNTTSSLTGVAYGNNIFGIVGNSGVIRISTDGITWTNSTSQLDITSLLVNHENLSFADGIFITSSNVSSISSKGWDNVQDFQGFNNISVSTDLNNWVIHRSNRLMSQGEIFTRDFRSMFKSFFLQSTNEFFFGNGFGEISRYSPNLLKTNTEEVRIILYKIPNIAT
jgi:hypothetical protein